MISTSVITGFLGSGKTTLLRRLLASPEMSHTAVLINEFGEVGIDHFLVRKVDENIVLLNSGCLCCTVRDDLVETLAGLQPELEDGHLEAWLRFSSEFLGTQCPDDLRIVSYAALEILDTEFEELGRRLKEQRRQPWCRTPAFRLSELPPLGKVAEADLLDFLEDPANSSCDPGIQTEIAERLITRTGGAFEETVALLQEAESGSWYDLLAQLRREQGGEQTSP